MAKDNPVKDQDPREQDSRPFAFREQDQTPAKDTRAEEMEKLEASRDRAQAKSRELRGVVQRYLRNHGQFRATTVTNQNGVQSGHEFVACECDICQDALGLVETPAYA